MLIDHAAGTETLTAPSLSERPGDFRPRHRLDLILVALSSFAMGPTIKSNKELEL